MNITIKDILKLLDKFEEASISELQLRDDTTELVLKKGVSGSEDKGPPITFKSEEAQTVETEEPPMMNRSAKASSKPSAEFSQQDLVAIRSPIVGTFYRSPAPDAPPFIKEGSKVKQGDPVGIIEAMKIMNKLDAEFDMEIVNILVQNTTMVEHGTLLFEVRKI